ncbi:MAG: WD40 repeat domain-containing protein [Planctomycetaceae bacterium]|jgi:WD40 repeat protein|nr:WD40 repeat domain-containing protein [Planctomycetaceae bacterium]
MKKIIELLFFCCVNLFLFFPIVFGVESSNSSSGSILKLDVNQLKPLCEHKENINAIAISPNGKLAATGSADRFLILSDINNSKELWRLQFRGVISSVAFTPDSKRILVGCRDKNLIICDVDSGKESARFNAFTRAITAIEVSPNGKYVAVGFDNGVTLILEIETKKLHKELSNVHSVSIFDISFSSKSDRVLIASQDASVSIWNVNDGKWIYSFKGHRGAVKSVSFDYRNEKIISSSMDRSVIVWKPSSNSKQDSKELILHRLIGHSAEVSFACFAPDAETAYSASTDKTLIQWNLRDGKQIAKIDVGQVVNRAVFSPATAYYVVWSSLKRAVVVKSEELKFTVPKYPVPEDKNPFPKLAVVSRPVMRLNAYVNVKVEGGVNSAAAGELKTFLPKGGKSCFFVDSQYAVTVGADNTGVVWNLETGKSEYLFSHSAALTAVAFSPLSAVIAAGSKDGSIILLNPKSGKTLTVFRGHTASITDLAFSSNGKRLASAGEDKLFITWNLDTGQSEGVSIGHKAKLSGVVISSDMSKAITVSADKTIRVWTSSNKSEVWNESKPENKRLEFTSIAIDSAGVWFAVGCENKTIEIWQAGEKKQIATLSGLRDVPVALAVSPDGRHLLSGGRDGVIVVWNTKTWKPEKTFVQLSEQLEKQISESKKGWIQSVLQAIEYEPIVSIKFSNDGKKIISSGGSNIYIWNGIKE